MKEEERIRCPVHDLISFKSQRPEDVVLWNLLQTPAVQRLRRIKQLGFSEFVYPGATHTRLSHVLGAMQMARRMLEVLQRNNAFGEVAELDRQRSATLTSRKDIWNVTRINALSCRARRPVTLVEINSFDFVMR
jgi:uncharacterized protein